MSDELKKFVSEHRQEFDANVPGKGLWEKIDAGLEAKHPSRISSNWLSKLKYLGFSASALVVAVYFITNNLNESPASGLTPDRKEPAMDHPGQGLKAHPNRPASHAVENNVTKEANDLPGSKSRSGESGPAASGNTGQRTGLTRDREKDPASGPGATGSKPFENALPAPEKNKADSALGFLPAETKSSSTDKKKESHSAGKSKKTGIYLPEEPGEMNTYTGTLYEGPFLCSVLSAYKFPGKVNMYKGDRSIDNKHLKRVLRTISCSRLEGMANIKAIWLKGKTDKKIILPIKKRFKNIVLVKSDGRKYSPEAISHYYPGRGVISEYTGNYFNMVFKDKVDLILFFKDAEEGDRLVIDGTIEAVVKNKP